MAGKVAGKVVVVTGASSGIGEATAVALAERGAKVAAVARRRDRLERLAARVAGSAGEVLSLEADVVNERQLRNAIEQAGDRWGGIDAVVANAGVMLLGPVREADTDDWRRMVEVNVLGAMYSIHAVLPYLLRQRAGDVVTMSSVAGRVARANNAAYAATKFAIRAFSEALRQEVGKDNVRVTIVEPGAVETELVEHITHPEAKAWAEQFYGSMQILRSEDIAAAVLYALEQPPYVDVNEILIRPTAQDR